VTVEGEIAVPGVTMSLHKLTAGSGYDHLIRRMAERSRSLWQTSRADTTLKNKRARTVPLVPMVVPIVSVERRNEPG
jgi:hypothetical protein